MRDLFLKQEHWKASERWYYRSNNHNEIQGIRLYFSVKKFWWYLALEAKIKDLQEQNETMRSALEFYADVKNWEGGHKYTDDDEATIFTDGSESGATVDKGSRASGY